MEITEEQYEKIAESFPKHRREAVISNLEVLNALLYVLENGCKWRALPEKYGNWHTIYVRMNRWAKNGVLQRVFAKLQETGVIPIEGKILALDSTCAKVHPDGMGALKKTANRQSARLGAAGTQKFI